MHRPKHGLNADHNTHPGQGFGHLVCSSASPQAAGAQCTEVAGHEKLHEWCSALTKTGGSKP